MQLSSTALLGVQSPVTKKKKKKKKENAQLTSKKAVTERKDIENKQQNDRYKSQLISNLIKWKWKNNRDLIKEMQKR